MAKKHAEAQVSIDVGRLARDIDVALRRGTNRARREATLGYYPSRLENLGVGAPHLRTVVRDVRRSLKGQAPRVALAMIPTWSGA